MIGLSSLPLIVFYYILETPEKKIDVKKLLEEDSKKLQLP